MTKKLKLGLGGLSFLAISGIALPSLGNNWNIFQSLEEISFRGGHFWVKEEINKKEKDLQLGLSGRRDSKTIVFKKPEVFQEIKLSEGESKQKLDISSDFLSSPENHIQSIFSEIKTEDKVTGIASNIREEFDELVKSFRNPKEHLSTFQRAKNKISWWTKVKESLIGRADNNNIPALNKNEKQNLKTMYQVFMKLQEIKKNLSNKLTEFDVPIVSTTSEPDRKEGNLDLQKTAKSLNQLGWDGELIRLERNRGPYGGKFSNNWGNWESNPFSNFYENEKEYEEDIKFANRMFDKIDGQVRVLQDQMNWDRRRTSQLQNRINFFKNLKNTNYPQKHIVIKVAEKLLQHMGQLN